jgi:tetratricopeptide (TPR) repeat protein
MVNSVTGNAKLARASAERMVAYLRKIVDADDEANAEGKVAMGVALSMAGFQAQAIEIFEDVLDQDADNCEALARLTFAFLRGGRTDAAVETAAQLVSVDSGYQMEEVTTGNSLSAFSIMGLASLGAGRERAALKAFERAYRESPEDSVAWAYLAQLRDEPSDIRVSSAASSNPRFSRLAGNVADGQLGVDATLAAASGALTSLVAHDAHGRPLIAARGGSLHAELTEGTAWSVSPSTN